MPRYSGAGRGTRLGQPNQAEGRASLVRATGILARARTRAHTTSLSGQRFDARQELDLNFDLPSHWHPGPGAHPRTYNFIEWSTIRRPPGT